MYFKDNKLFLNQVTMIESKQEPLSFKKKINLPATLFNKSPLRERVEQSNRVATPSKLSRTRLSPFKSRRRQQNHIGKPEQPSLIMSKMNSSRQTTGTSNCENHANKQATYIAYGDGYEMSYCEKCAVKLITQGFKVTKIDLKKQTVNTLDELQDTPERKQVIVNFLSDLSTILKSIGVKKSEISNCLKRSDIQYQTESQKINNYYQTLINSVENHRKLALQTLHQQQSIAQTQVYHHEKTLAQFQTQCNSMREDILGSLEIIKSVQQTSFEAVLEAHKQKCKQFKRFLNCLLPVVNVKNVTFNDPQQVSRKLTSLIQINFDQNDKTLPKAYLKEKKSSVYFSFENQPEETNSQLSKNLIQQPQEPQNSSRHLKDLYADFVDQ